MVFLLKVSCFLFDLRRWSLHDDLGVRVSGTVRGIPEKFIIAREKRQRAAKVVSLTVFETESYSGGLVV